MQYFPLFMNLRDRPILVVGGGEVACRKVDSLIRAGANVSIVSPQIDLYLQRLVERNECHWIQNFYSKKILDKKYLQVWATTDNPELNHRVHDDAKALGILVNVVDNQPYCDFITPSVITRGRIQIAISSGGASPVLIRNIREQLESILAFNLSLLADFGLSKRGDIKQRLPSVDLRRKFWEMFFARTNVQNATERCQLEAEYSKLLDSEIQSHGSITWVEFGNDVELLPIKALRLMQQSEQVLYCPQCPDEFLELSRRDAERHMYENEVDLSERLVIGRKHNMRVVVFVPSEATEYKLLINGDLHIRPGSV